LLDLDVRDGCPPSPWITPREKSAEESFDGAPRPKKKASPFLKMFSGKILASFSQEVTLPSTSSLPPPTEKQDQSRHPEFPKPPPLSDESPEIDGQESHSVPR